MTQRADPAGEAPGLSGSDPTIEPTVRIIPLGGLGEIGLNMMLLESGEDLLAVDCGLMFPDDEMPGIDYVIPDFSYLLAKRAHLRGVIITHGHEDHIGALPYLLREVDVPVYGTRIALALATEHLRETMKLEDHHAIRDAIERLSEATMRLAEFIMNSAISKALKDKRVREVQ